MQYQLVRQLASARSLLAIGLLATMVFVACSSDDHGLYDHATVNARCSARR